MTAFVALLRAVNVGGTGKLPMGEVIFDSEVTPHMMALLDQAFSSRLGQALEDLVKTWGQVLEELL